MARRSTQRSKTRAHALTLATYTAAIFLSALLLFGVQPIDLPTIAGVVVVLLIVGSIACFVPARRAAGTDIVAALRVE